MTAYSFLDTQVSMVGPGVAVNLGPGSANTEGGINITPTEDVNSMAVGADGSVMHSLHAGSSGSVTVRLQQTSPTNQILSEAYNFQRSSAARHGLNVITIREVGRGDIITCQEVAFARFPDVVYAKDGAERVWTFHAGKIDYLFGAGIDVAA